MAITKSLTQVKARLSEVVRAARQGGEETIITVDGEPAARLVPVDGPPRDLTDAEVAAVRVLLDAIARLEQVPGPFDAVDLVAEGRR
jgi:prevent-host-death family protein